MSVLSPNGLNDLSRQGLCPNYPYIPSTCLVLDAQLHKIISQLKLFCKFEGNVCNSGKLPIRPPLLFS